jgi:hypothetical protein
MMLNAKIKAAVSFKDCHKNEVFTADAHKMVGAVAGESNYMKLFEKILKPGFAEGFKK